MNEDNTQRDECTWIRYRDTDRWKKKTKNKKQRQEVTNIALCHMGIGKVLSCSPTTPYAVSLYFFKNCFTAGILSRDPG